MDLAQALTLALLFPIPSTTSAPRQQGSRIHQVPLPEDMAVLAVEASVEAVSAAEAVASAAEAASGKQILFQEPYCSKRKAPGTNCSGGLSCISH